MPDQHNLRSVFPILNRENKTHRICTEELGGPRDGSHTSPAFEGVDRMVVICVYEGGANEGPEKLHEHVEERLTPWKTTKHCLANCNLNFGQSFESHR